jgi:Fis family transcriptional regulator, factor for inversion stimulation protein
MMGNRELATNRKPAALNGASPEHVVDGALGRMAHEALQSYFTTLNGHKPEELYDLVIGEVEKPLFRAVLDYTGGNQSLAASILGINRGTLRKKLRQHGMLD